MKIASFNISGGFYGGDESSEYLDREAATSIDNQLLCDIIRLINNEDIDIIALQEVITTEEYNYINQIKDGTKLKYSEMFELSPCNLVKGAKCGLAILSKYPIDKSQKNIFKNPKLSKTTASGNVYYTYDKGWLLCAININNKTLEILTHHGFPYRRFDSTPEANITVFQEFDNIIKNNKVDIVTGDFNAENFMELMQYTASKYQRTINYITTVDDKRFDDILILKDKDYSSKVIKSMSDHYLVITKI